MTPSGPQPMSGASGSVMLPPERAFVIQLRASTGGDAELFTGRAEHIASGEETRFSSVPELIAFVRQVLANDLATTAVEAKEAR